MMVVLLFVLLSAGALDAQPAEQSIAALISNHQYDLDGNGFDFLVDNAQRNDFFLLGELHGDKQIPDLLRRFWPELWKHGYRHIAAEVSPWAANQLEFVRNGPEILGLWTKAEAANVHAMAEAGGSVLWGCDMEEIQPDLLLRALADVNPNDAYLRQMVSLTSNGYKRRLAPQLLELALRDSDSSDEIVNDISLRTNLLATLRIETDRLNADDKMVAQNERERLMKEQFVAHFKAASHPGKILLRFGRNHLHRGYDARGISTLGNFIVEFAAERGQAAFNVGAFGAGGTAKLLGETWNADERKDEATFALLADKAKYAATIFDLRSLRPVLHKIPSEKRTALQTNLMYWADSYDGLICYKTVTPR